MGEPRAAISLPVSRCAEATPSRGPAATLCTLPRFKLSYLFASLQSADGTGSMVFLDNCLKILEQLLGTLDRCVTT
jgi:hypothetical protein